MPIEFACHCGNRLLVGDEHAGKRAKCSQCGQVVIIPGGKPEAAKTVAKATSAAAASAALISKSIAPSTRTTAPVASSGRRCPSCHGPLSAEAVLCVNCGYNLKSGKKMSTFAYAPTEDDEVPTSRPRSRINRVVMSRLTSWKLWSGLGMMILGGGLGWVIMNSEQMHFRARTFGLIAVLFLGGGFTFINGLCDGDDTQ
jgi:hypothetical protein